MTASGMIGMPPALAVAEVDHRQRRNHAVVDLELLADSRVELIGDQRTRDVPSERAIPRQRRKRPRAEPLVGDRVRVGHAERERRIRIEEELVHVVVVDHQQAVGVELCEPPADLLEWTEQRLPFVVAPCLLAGVVDVLHRWRVRCADPSHDSGHQPLSLICLPISSSGVFVTPESFTIT